MCTVIFGSFDGKGNRILGLVKLHKVTGVRLVDSMAMCEAQLSSPMLTKPHHPHMMWVKHGQTITKTIPKSSHFL